MTTTFADIEPLSDAGQTNAEIAAELLARRWTVRPIPAGAIRNWLRETHVGGEPIARLNISGGWEGVLPTVGASGQVPPELADGIRDTLSHLLMPSSEELQTDRGAAGSLLDGIAAAVGLSAEQRMELYALGGGERYADATEDRVTELVTAHDTLSRYRDVHSAHVAPVLDSGSPTVATMAAAFRAAADAMEAA